MGREPKIIQCKCGRRVECDGFTNTCDRCGADYNWAGERLAPRSEWGEETGESAADIMAIDTMSTDTLLEGDW